MRSVLIPGTGMVIFDETARRRTRRACSRCSSKEFSDVNVKQTISPLKVGKRRSSIGKLANPRAISRVQLYHSRSELALQSKHGKKQPLAHSRFRYKRWLKRYFNSRACVNARHPRRWEKKPVTSVRFQPNDEFHTVDCFSIASFLALRVENE